MLSPDILTFREFIVDEPLPLATIQNAVLEFLRNRDDAVVFDAQAVNAYVGEPRMTQDIGLVSPRAAETAHELREYLSQRFHIAVRMREIGAGRGYRLYQVQKPGNRHLVDIRSSPTVPLSRRIAGVLVLAPEELIASKVIACHQRRGRPEAGTDWRDLALLLLTFPELKSVPGPVADRLRAAKVEADVLALWADLVAQDIQPEDDEF